MPNALASPKLFTIYDSDDQQRVIKQIYKELMIDDKFLPVKSAISQISGYKDKLLSAKDVAAEAPRDTKAALISKKSIPPIPTGCARLVPWTLTI